MMPFKSPYLQVPSLLPTVSAYKEVVRYTNLHGLRIELAMKFHHQLCSKVILVQKQLTRVFGH